jgi:Tfp pilus assembly protein FimT
MSGRRVRRRAFTLFELVVLVIVISIVAMIVIPAGGVSGSSRLGAAANILAADLEYAQSSCIANPAQPVALTFNVAQNKYSLAPANSPGTPILHPADSSQLYVNDFATGRYAPLNGVRIVSVNGQTSGSITFDAYGRPLGCNAAGITYSVGTVTVVLSYDSTQLSVISDATTGDVSIP